MRSDMCVTLAHAAALAALTGELILRVVDNEFPAWAAAVLSPLLLLSDPRVHL